MKIKHIKPRKTHPNNTFSIQNNDFLLKMILLILFMFLIVLLVNSDLTKKYAFLGLNIWYKNMIPTLFPFLFLMNYIIKNELTTYFIKPISFLLKPLFRINDECIFVIFFGFLCGFPLGAKSSISLYQNKKITKQEAEYLLCFTNNLGPAYIIGFVYNTILSDNHNDITLREILFILYAIPLLYGLLLRYTIYLKKINTFNIQNTQSSKAISDKHLISSIPTCLNDTLYQIGLLGGYMILFNTIRVIPVLLFQKNRILYIFFQCILEISGGLICLKENITNMHYFILLCLTTISFGGLSCYFQTSSILCETDIPSQKYMLHKLILCSITLLLLFVLLK